MSVREITEIVEIGYSFSFNFEIPLSDELSVTNHMILTVWYANGG